MATSAAFTPPPDPIAQSDGRVLYARTHKSDKNGDIVIVFPRNFGVTPVILATPATNGEQFIFVRVASVSASQTVIVVKHLESGSMKPSSDTTVHVCAVSPE